MLEQAPPACSAPPGGPAPETGRIGPTWRAAEGTWQVSGRCVPGRLVRAAFPQQLMLCSQLVPLLGSSSSPPPPPPMDGRSGWQGSHLAPAQVGWLPTPMFCSQSLECPGTRAGAPWGDMGAISLISSLDRFLAHFQPGTRQPPSPSCCQSCSVCVCPSSGSQGAVRLGAGGFPEGSGSGSPRLSAVGLGHALNGSLPSPFQLLFFHRLLCL